MVTNWSAQCACELPGQRAGNSSRSRSRSGKFRQCPSRPLPTLRLQPSAGAEPTPKPHRREDSRRGPVRRRAHEPSPSLTRLFIHNCQIASLASIVFLLFDFSNHNAEPPKSERPPPSPVQPFSTPYIRPQEYRESPQYLTRICWAKRASNPSSNPRAPDLKSAAFRRSSTQRDTRNEADKCERGHRRVRN